MSQETGKNVKKSLTKEWMNERRRFLRFIFPLTAGALTACLSQIGAEDDLDMAIATDEISQNPTQMPTAMSAQFGTETQPPALTTEPHPNYPCEPATGGCYIITSLCLRDRGCIDVCPVECIVPGFPISEWPWAYIDPDICIDCGACVPECPYGAIFPEDEVPSNYVARGGEYISRPGLKGHYEGINHHGQQVVLDCVYQLKPGEIVDLTQDNTCNYAFFRYGPGYSAKDQDNGM